MTDITKELGLNNPEFTSIEDCELGHVVTVGTFVGEPGYAMYFDGDFNRINPCAEVTASYASIEGCRFVVPEKLDG